MSDEPDNDPPCSKVKSSPSLIKSGDAILEVTPKAANATDIPLVRNGFRYSMVNFDFEALLYSTISVNKLKKKLDSYHYKWEGAAAPAYARGEVDDEYGMCPHCRKYRWFCHEQKYGRYCVEAVKRFVEWRSTGSITPEEALVVFLNYYNRPLDYCKFDELDDPNKEEQPYLDNMDHKYPPKCMEITSLIHVLQWAYWKESRMKAKQAKRRAERALKQAESSVSSKKTKE